MTFEVVDANGKASTFDGRAAALNAQIADVVKKYQPRIQALQDEGTQLKDGAIKPENWEAMINVDFDVTWSVQRIVFDFPEVTFKDQRISFDLPEVRMELQRIVFDLPAVRMVDRVIGQKPEWYGPFNMVWTDMIISVPEAYMQRNEIKLDIPSVTMKRQEIVIGLPEFKMTRVEWKIGLPQFTIHNVRAETTKLEDTGKRLQTEGATIGAAMKAEIDTLVGQFMQGAGGVAGAITTTRNSFDSALSSLGNAITDLSARGVDPIKVPTDNGDINLRKQFEQLATTRDEVIPRMEAIVASVAAPSAAESFVPS